MKRIANAERAGFESFLLDELEMLCVFTSQEHLKTFRT
jgi:hypothetical protein